MPDEPAPASTEPIVPPPSAARPAVQPISAAELTAEIAGAPPNSLPIEEPKPLPSDDVFIPAPQPVHVDPKDRSEEEVKSKAPSFKDAMRKRLLDEQDNPKPEKKEEAPVEPKAEVKPEEPKVEETPAEPKAEESPSEEEVPSGETDELATGSSKTAKRFQDLLKENKELKSKAQSPTDTEEITKMKEDLQSSSDEVLKYRRMYDWENDPELKTKYIEPTAAAETAIEGILTGAGFQEGTIDAIKSEGGFAAFSRSNKTFPITVADPDDPDATVVIQKSASELAASWLNQLPIADGEMVRQHVGRQQTLTAEMGAAKDAAIADAKAYFDQKGATGAQAQADAEATQVKATKEYGDWMAKTNDETDFLKIREVPADASEELKAEITSENAFTTGLRAGLEKHPTTALEYGELKLAAAEAQHLRRTSVSKDTEIAALKAQLTKAKGAMRTTSKGGSILAGNTSPAAPPANADPTDFKSAMRARIRSGEVQADA